MWQESKQKGKFKDRKGSDRQSTKQSGSPANPPRILPVQGSRRARDGGRERQRYKCKRERERGSWEGGSFRRSDSSTSIPADSHVCFKRVSVCVCVCVCVCGAIDAGERWAVDIYTRIPLATTPIVKLNWVGMRHPRPHPGHVAGTVRGCKVPFLPAQAQRSVSVSQRLCRVQSTSSRVPSAGWFWEVFV